MPHALVLAGGSREGSLERALDLPTKALAPIGDRPMLSFVLAALEAANCIRQTVVVGPKAALQESLGAQAGPVAFIEQTGSLLDNVRRGWEALPGDDRILVVSADVPLVTNGVIERFVDACPADEARFFYPIVERSVCEAAYPTTKRTYVRLRDGTFTGGNLILSERATLAAALDMAASAVEARKKPWRLAMLLGPGLIARWILGRLAVADLERWASRRLGSPCRAVVSQDPELAVDVDKPEDLELVGDVLGIAEQPRQGADDARPG